MKNKNISIFFALTFLLVLPAFVHAQPGFSDDVNDVPIDGGLSLLVAAGVGYGAKKIKQFKCQHNSKTGTTI